MEAAAKTVHLLTQRILPEKPHHLSYSTDWKCRPPHDDNAKHFEEWDNPRLQYMTFVSEADRGLLLTRPYYDMRVEPSKPVPREVNALAKPSGEKKKLSLSDYKNKKTTVPPSDTYSEPAITKRREPDRGPAPVLTGTKPTMDNRKADGQRLPSGIDGKPPKPREPVVDMRLPPKPPVSLPPRPPSPERPQSERRKRALDDDDFRAQKRLRADLGRPTDDRSRTPRDEPPRRKDRDLHSSQDRTSQRDVRNHVSSSMPNGRAPIKSMTGANRIPSPAGRARGESINGVRPNLSGTSKSLSAKYDSPKSSLPPLLSPLRLSLDGREGDAPEKVEKKKPRDSSVDSARPIKARKSDAPSTNKGDKSPLRLLPLLSPTLPPSIEAELNRRKKESPKASNSKSRETTARKAPVEQDESDSDRDGKGKEPPRRLIVTIKIPKRLRLSFKRILALNPRSQAHEQERSGTLEGAMSQAKKHPSGTSSENVQDSIAVKRPRPSDIPISSRLPPPPQTPSKKSTAAMSRANSSNSHTNTPGDATTATPSARGSSEQTLNGNDAPRSDPAQGQVFKDRQNRLVTLGKRLKHIGDSAMTRPGGASTSASGSRHPSESNPYMGYVLTLESILAFMGSFHALNQIREMSSKAYDPSGWESVIPLIEYLQGHLRRAENPRRVQPLNMLSILLQAFTWQQVGRSYSTLEHTSPQFDKIDLARVMRSCQRSWQVLGELNESMEQQFRIEVPAWATVKDIGAETLRILKRWCNEHQVDWTPTINLRELSDFKN